MVAASAGQAGQAVAAPVLSASPGALPGAPLNAEPSPANAQNFMSLINTALQGVSAAQGSAARAQAGYAADLPGATLAKALVASDRAEVAWNATVAVRNEIVSAYQSIMNMQF